MKRGFALIELIVTMIAIGAMVVVLYTVIKPGEVLKKSRDSNRFADINNLSAAINSYLADNHDFNDLIGPYTSINPGFPKDEGRKKIDGTGWIPLNFNLVTAGAPIASLPIDPINDEDFHYSFAVSVKAGTYELNCVFESIENQSKSSLDNGSDNVIYEIGTDLNLL